MLTWALDHWELIVAIICGIERVWATKSEFGKRLHALMGAIEQQHNLSEGSRIASTAKSLIPDKFKGDIILDTILDKAIDVKVSNNGTPARRVSKARRLRNNLFRAIPFVSLILGK